jgi:glycosyltransferase involved in cell wall biosynthesis
MQSPIKISVIIPTHNRPELVKRAIVSVYAQDLDQASTIVEVIVVINGNDVVTRSALESLNTSLNYSNLKILQIPEAGPSHARNVGVQKALGEWIAFLDDDDEWLPKKLRLQYEAAIASNVSNPVIASKLTARTPKGDFDRPRRFPKPCEDLSDYLLGRTGFFQGEGLIQTSVIFTTRRLLLKVPFSLIPKHEDWEWVLRVAKRSDVTIEFIPEILAIWYLEENRTSLSTRHNYQGSLDWITRNRDLVTPTAYAAFILVEVGSQAAQQQQWKLFPKLLKLALTQGKPNAIVLLLYLAMWLLPLELRRKIRAILTRKKNSNSHPIPDLKFKI